MWRDSLEHQDRADCLEELGGADTTAMEELGRADTTAMEKLGRADTRVLEELQLLLSPGADTDTLEEPWGPEETAPDRAESARGVRGGESGRQAPQGAGRGGGQAESRPDTHVYISYITYTSFLYTTYTLFLYTTYNSLPYITDTSVVSTC